MRYLLLHAPTWSPEPIARALAAEQVEARVLAAGEAFVPDGRPTVYVLDAPARSTMPAAALTAMVAAGSAILALGAPGETDIPRALPEDLLSAFIPHPVGPRQLLVALRTVYREAAGRLDAARARAELSTRASEVTELTDIGILLTTEKNYNTLLDLILSQARRITQADAGSLYLVEGDGDAGRRLRFKLTQNHSRPDIPFVEFTIPLDHASLAGYAAADGDALVIDDVYDLPPGVPYSFNRSFDERYGYRTRSVVSIPMQNHHGEVIGLLQLINHKRDAAALLATPADTARSVLPFSPHSVKLLKALASQAAVAIENSQLYEAIERLFEGFVKAAVVAIEQRDPSTSGHSLRVATMTVGLAEAVDQVQHGMYRNVRFSVDQVRELRYAGLLHDFGKVGVREQVLVKAKKLYASDFALIRERQAFLMRTAQWRLERERARYLEETGTRGYREFLAELEHAHREEIRTLERFLGVVLESNEPTVLTEGTFGQLREFSELTYETIDGRTLPYLSDDEVRFLSIQKGSLDESERLEIESHVSHTYQFLKRIPWTKGLMDVPEIAHGHHEKLNGMGYPRGVDGRAIPIQTRMMSIADIFDALTASDRPYKRAVPAARALAILEDEVHTGMLDGDLFRVFVEANVFEKNAPDS